MAEVNTSVLVIRRIDGLNSKPAQSAQPLKLTNEDYIIKPLSPKDIFSTEILMPWRISPEKYARRTWVLIRLSDKQRLTISESISVNLGRGRTESKTCSINSTALTIVRLQFAEY